MPHTFVVRKAGTRRLFIDGKISSSVFVTDPKPRKAYIHALHTAHTGHSIFKLVGW